jgi:hypothetical protein
MKFGLSDARFLPDVYVDLKDYIPFDYLSENWFHKYNKLTDDKSNSFRAIISSDNIVHNGKVVYGSYSDISKQCQVINGAEDAFTSFRIVGIRIYNFKGIWKN